MTVSTIYAPIEYAGDASTVAFPVPWMFLEADDLRITKIDDATDAETDVTTFTASGVGEPTGGTAILPAALGTGYTLRIERRTDRTQEMDLQPQGRFPAESLERSVDKLTLIVQELEADDGSGGGGTGTAIETIVTDDPSTLQIVKIGTEVTLNALATNPTGPAGGDLAGTYPDPIVKQATGVGSLLLEVETDFTWSGWAGGTTLGGRGIAAGYAWFGDPGSQVHLPVWCANDAYATLYWSRDFWVTTVADSSLAGIIGVGTLEVKPPCMAYVEIAGVWCWVLTSDSDGAWWYAQDIAANYNPDGTLEVAAWVAGTPATRVMADIATDTETGVSCMVGNHGYITRTADWITWTDEYNTGGTVIGGIATDNDGTWIAVTTTGTLLRSVDGGLTWTTPTIYERAGESGAYASTASLINAGNVIHGNGIWLVTGASSYAYSTDGIYWTVETTTLGVFYGVGFDGTRWFATNPNNGADPAIIYQIIVSSVLMHRQVVAEKGFASAGPDYFKSLPNVVALGTDQNGKQIDAELDNALDSSKGAGLIGYKGRTVADRLSDVVSVKDGPNAAKGDGTLEDITGIDTKAAEASAAGKLLFFPAGTYLFPSGFEFDGTLFIEGEGDSTVLRFDGDVIKITNGPGSYVRNLRIEAVTVPTVVVRTDANGDPQSPAMVLGGEGYQPSANDSDIWSGLSPEIQAQNVYCRITLDTCGAGFVENVSGEYALIEVIDGQSAHVSDCRVMGGKGQNGTIVIRNRATTVGYGLNNKALRNTVTYGTYSGIAFMGQKYPTAHGNTVFGVGESGVKTFQNTSGGEDARAYHATITKNTISRCYYDGIDAAMNFPAVSGTVSKHRVTHNTVNYCQHSGIWTDAEGATISNNFVGRSYGRGIHLNQGQKCLVHNNVLDDNNLDDSASFHHITDGGTSNEIHRNYVRCATTTSKAIYVNPSKGASIFDNTVNGGTIQISAGNAYSGNKCLNADSTSLQIGSVLATDTNAEVTGGYIGEDGILYRNNKHIRIFGTLPTAIGYTHIATNSRLTGLFTFACQDSSGGYYATIALSTISNVINSRSSVQVISQNSWGTAPCALDGTQWQVRSTAATRTTATLAFVTNRVLTTTTAYELNGIGNASYPTDDVTDEVRATGVGVFEAGWGEDTGTAKKTANATYAVGAGLTVGAAYVQAEVQAIITRLSLVEAALQDATQTIKAIKDNRFTRKEIGA